MIIWRILLPLLLFSMQYMLYRRTKRWLQETRPNDKRYLTMARALFIVFNVAALYAMIQRPDLNESPGWFVYGGLYPYFIWHGATFFIGLIVTLTSLVKLPFKGVFWLVKRTRKNQFAQLQANPAYQRFNESRRTFLRRSMYGLTAVSFGGSAYGLTVDKSDCEITEAEFPIQNLPEALDGFTIALIADIHSSIYMMRPEMEEYARLVNSLGADLIVVNGDFVNSTVEEVYPFAEAFGRLSAPYGIFGVMGNHEFYTTDPERVAREVNDCGIILLRDEKILVQRNGGQFYLIGVDDIGRSTSASVKLDVAIGQAPLPIPRILLCHRPYYLPQAARRNIDLMLSGHTHGGQVVLGRFGETVIAPASLVSRYVWGAYREGNAQMYVSRGIGTVGLPIRINCPPEITKITLRSTFARG